MRQRNGIVECWRLLFTWFVLMLHSAYVSNGADAMFKGGWIGVEFFFLLSGYLMAKQESTLIPADGPTTVGRDTLRFILQKIKRLMPYYTFALIINFIVWSIPFGGFSRRYVGRAISGLLNYIFAYSAGFRNEDFFYLGYSWYISAMVLSMLLLFPLLRRNRTMFYCVYAPLITVFGMGLFAFLYRKLGYVTSGGWVLSNGILRASFNLCLGCLSYALSEKLKQYQFTRLGAHLLSVVLLLGTVIGSYRIIFLQADHINDFLLVLLFALMIAIAFSEKSSISFSFRPSVGNLIGNFSYAVFITSNCWSYLIARLFPDWTYQKAVAVYVVLALLCACSCMLICDTFVKCYQKMRDKILRTIIAC